jgi:hypothetical protein
VAGAGCHCLWPLRAVAAWSVRNGACCERATAVGVCRWALPFSSSLLLLCRHCHGGGAGGCVGACRWLQGGALSVPYLFRQSRCGSGWERATATTGIVLTSLVHIQAKAFTNVVSCDGGGAHWASFFLAKGAIVGH